MKKQLLSLAAACTMLFATACNSDTSNSDQQVTRTEMMRGEGMEDGEMHDEMMHDENMEHQQMTNASAEEAAYEGPTFEQVPAPAKEQVQQLTKHYLEVKNALVATNAAEAQAAAANMLKPMDQFKATSLPADQQEVYQKQIVSIRDAATAISNSNDVEAQRKQLGSLSQGIYTLNKAFASNDQSLYRQYCPMANNNKGGYWVSAEKEVRNPYFGDKMLKCGSVKETL